jgi:hypothetical protein
MCCEGIEAVNDAFRLDLADYDKDYILAVLQGFCERASDHHRRMIEIRMSQEMLAKLEIDPDCGGFLFRYVPIIVEEYELPDTVELLLAPLH